MIQINKLFPDDNENFYCEAYNCFFIDRSCSEESIVNKLTNFTIRFNDSLGFTIPPSIFLRDGFLMAGNI